MTKVAFYKGRGGFLDWAIRTGTRSTYSHVEVVGTTGRGFSSSFMDGGVRIKEIDFDDGNWEVVDVPWANQEMSEKLVAHEVGKKYDFKGVFLSQMLSLNRAQSGRWFCSEIVAYALGLPAPHLQSPGSLYQTVKHMNEMYETYHLG